MKTLLLSLLAGIVGSLMVYAEPNSGLILWYQQPASSAMNEALPIGNGRLGGVVFGGVERERIQFNEDSLWTGDDNPSGDDNTMGAYQAFGDLILSFDDGVDAPVQNYRRQLDLATATARTPSAKAPRLGRFANLAG